jgi:hypothetical protein
MVHGKIRKKDEELKLIAPSDQVHRGFAETIRRENAGDECSASAQGQSVPGRQAALRQQSP